MIRRGFKGVVALTQQLDDLLGAHSLQLILGQQIPIELQPLILVWPSAISPA